MGGLTPQTLDLFALGMAVAGLVLAFVAYRRSKAAEQQAEAEAVALSGEEREVRPGLWRAILGPIAVHFRPTTQNELETLVSRLQRAGRRGRNEVDRFVEEKFLGVLLGFGLGFVCALSVGGTMGLLLLLVLGVVGLLGAEKLLEARGDERREAVARALPGAVDLLFTCLDAGLSLEQALARVAKDLAHASPTLAEELRITASEIEAGVSLPDALRRLARRVGLDELSALCGVIAQAHGLGAPIAQTLREYAESSRKQRMALLEERAGKLSTQLTLPLALCLLPAAMMAIMAPAVLQLFRTLR